MFNSEFVDEEDMEKDHPNIVQIKRICKTESCIMMEFMSLDLQPFGSVNVVYSVNDLLLQLSKSRSHVYDFIILKLAQGILDGLSFVHELGVTNRYFKSSKNTSQQP